MKDFPIVQKTVKSTDGTKIGYQVIGKGPKTIILCNGLGGTVVAWKPLYTRFADHYRFIAWDYRGLFHSDPPADEARMTISDHVADLAAIVKKEKISKAVVAGWSMGVQVCLESYRSLSPIFEGMILLNGTYGSPFDTALNSPLSRYILPKVNELAQKIVPAVQPAIKPLAIRLIDWKGLINLIAKLGLVHENLDSEIFQEVARGMLQTDLKMYHEIMRHLGEHDASDLLPKIKVPTLVMAGDSDLLTPMKVAEKMAEEIPNAQLLIVPGGTHYCILEFPEMINMRVEKFLGELEKR
ncbi:MAG: alpha/beta hydrolase [Deltaproteobacteria bacterium]|nr:alpha/beta hydrolase [Deltaproteobacteria bacterium]